ncbi:hypothetical protein DOM21_18730 [Bacteriovorax stolpii]|uniref:Uncharacterized protein n=1 Tax=Bacteriovorax stolpii TaxID=960 RepID=A0A2K9NM78_BACTC|nr:hypothetical protein [Bacteriovorax stolpii]AUN96616.1 hypothetical protein C0V70_00540 [Bacteriovorax stolpii]QDK43452.1 hypothetical protein DOM21_18730 [Bacteriovorax stolpii]TDP53862.1 hypothetical protein C8D79_1140 [Bacteriovorax stolpii]BDT26638.1 hypothetical protein BHI3_01040 [Bacteriovorax sp. HI3]
MFRSGLTKGIYENFLRSHNLNRSELETSPFIFVDPASGHMKLLTNLMSSNEYDREIFAVAVAEGGGDVEVLSTAENN